MKNPIYLFALAVLFITACNQPDETRSFISGTYVNQSKGEYSIASDTLVIEASESNNYFIHRKTGFNRIRNGKKGIREHETEEWNAIYDEGTKSLTETRTGKLITFYPEANKLMVVKREYIKLK
jgi:hypothetical protein